MSNIKVFSLDASQVKKLSKQWTETANLVPAWRDIDILADRFLRVGSDDVAASTDVWHHLLMAVGNFKRSAGLIVPAPLTGATCHSNRSDRIVIPGADPNEAEVLREDSTTWRRLTKIVGLRAPTATTLLSALWPRYHVIIDKTDTDAATGLDAAPSLMNNGLNSASIPRGADSYWELYEWFRSATVETANSLNTSESPCFPVEVERALFRLDKNVRSTKKLSDGTWCWSEYRALAEESLRDLDKR